MAFEASSAAAASGWAAPRLSSMAIWSNHNALTLSTRSAARFHSTCAVSRMRSGNRSSSQPGWMPLAMRTSGAFWSRRSSASTATRNSSPVTVLDGASCAGPPAASCNSAPWRRRATRSGKAASTDIKSASSSRRRWRGGSTMRRTCRTVCAVRGSHGDSISTSRSERVAWSSRAGKRSPALSSAATVQPSSATPRRRASTTSRDRRGCSG